MVIQDVSIKLDDFLFIGHPQPEVYYVNSIRSRVDNSEWKGSIELQGNNVLGVNLMSPKIEDDLIWEEHRYIRKTDKLIICSGSKIDFFDENYDEFLKVVQASYVDIMNPDYMTFTEFTRKVKKDPLKDLDSLTSITPEQAKKYFEYRKEYDASDCSNAHILHPFYYTFDDGIVISLHKGQVVELNLGTYEDRTLKGFRLKICEEGEV